METDVQSILSGRCLCGEIQFRATQVADAYVCHCGDCRRHNGAPFHSIPVSDFTLKSGKNYFREFDSSLWAMRSFCSRCGSGICYRTKDHAYYGLSFGSVTGDSKPRFTKHIYVESAESSPEQPTTPDIWDDLPRMTGKQFLHAMGLHEFADQVNENMPKAIVATTAGEVSGGCSCGGVRFHTESTRLRPLLVCHCLQCRRQASGYYRVTAVEKEYLTLTARRTLVWYHSSDFARRGFCGTCGSLLFWVEEETKRRNADTSNMISILTGAFDRRLTLPLENHWFREQAIAPVP